MADHTHLSSPYRLPRSVVPRRYELTFEPDLDGGTFSGRARIAVEVEETAEAVWLNAADLDINAAALEDDAGRRTQVATSLDSVTQRLQLQPPEKLEPGPWIVDLSFRGRLNDELRGFYRSTFRDAEGRRRVLACTQFQATDARRAFPCWDEPDFKAVFAVTLVIPPDLLAVANSAEIARVPRDDGKVVVHFADSIPMSTYLVAFVVGPLEATEPVDVDGIPLRVVHAPGRGDTTAFALEVGAACLRWFADFYGIPYPGDKCDFIAIPDFAAGAMENLGAVTFRESSLLVDPATTSQDELQEAAETIAHELAHMWFGDLVTMRWWEGIWLNEAFATLMSLLALDALKPEWDVWLGFTADRAGAMSLDALQATRPVEFPVGPPEEADEMFDPLTYMKGCAVLRMLQQYLGAETFRAGVNAYLSRHRFGNTETADLWHSLAEAGGEPVGEIMEGWIHRGGFPRIDVALDDPGSVRLAQRRFLYLGDGEEIERWQVPVLIRTGTGVERTLLTAQEATLPVPAPARFVVINAGAHGFYRTSYGDGPGAVLRARLGELSGAERLALLDDTLALMLAGDTAAAGFLDLAAAYRDEEEYHVWRVLVRGLDEIDRIAGEEELAALRARVRDLLAPVAVRLGPASTSGEPDLRRKLRGLLLEARGRLGRDPAAVEQGRRIVEAETGSSDPELEAAALELVAAVGDTADYETFVARYRRESDPVLKDRYRRALTRLPDPALAVETFAMTLDGRIPKQDGPGAAIDLLRNPAAGAAVWEQFTARWEQVKAVYPPPTMAMSLYGLPYLSWPHLLQDARRFLESRHVPAGERLKWRMLELQEARVRFRLREAPRLGAYLQPPR